MAVSCLSPPPPTLPSLSISNHKLKLYPYNTNYSPPPSTSPLTLSTRARLKECGVNSKRKLQIWRILATPQESLASDVTSAIETSQQIISSGDDGVDTIISSLLLIAFVVLSILTVGVIYIGVTDFLQKRERDKFEKEEATKKKKDGKKKRVRGRARPRGFGQEIAEEDDAIDLD